jgi:hypothetical protein
MISQYDEFPVHQSPYPFSDIPVTDYSWDDGYFFGIYNAAANVFFFSGMRVSPNTDMIAAYAGVSIGGHQHTTRLKRPWREHMDTSIGPLRYEFVEPLKAIRLVLDDNDSDLTFDLTWRAVGSVYQEPHHLAWSRGRRTTDQTRYYQSGTAHGFINFGDTRFDVIDGEWWASRDHSWGLYAQRPPLVPDGRWLPPPEIPAVRQGLRWASWWGSPDHSGVFSVHESEHGERVQMNDTFGTPLQGGIDVQPGPRRLMLADAQQTLELHPGTQVLERATWVLTDEVGGTWTQVYEPVPGGWTPLTIGYGGGSWTDGGSNATWAGEGIRQESDSFDFSERVYDHTLYGGFELKGISSPEYLAAVTTTAPDGTVATGSAHIEMFLTPTYQPK